MNKIIILVGENISNLVFQCGGRKEQGIFIEEYGVVKWIHHVDSTSRHCPENNKHPKVYQKWLIQDINYVIDNWDYIISTNSSNTIDIICAAIRNKMFNADLVIYGLSKDNKEIIFESTLDKEEYYLHNWRYGFMDIE